MNLKTLQENILKGVVLWEADEPQTVTSSKNGTHMINYPEISAVAARWRFNISAGEEIFDTCKPSYMFG